MSITIQCIHHSPYDPMHSTFSYHTPIHGKVMQTDDIPRLIPSEVKSETRAADVDR